jgi:peptidyl-prolyl cis-trans isomerase D
MLKTIQNRNTMVKVVLGVVLGIICLSMALTLGVGSFGTLTDSGDALARVGGADITQNDVQTLLARVSRNQPIPPMMRDLYARNVLDQLVLQKSLELEATRLGLRVTPEEQANRIKLILPTVFNGDTWVGKDRYASEVQNRTGMGVQEFEDYVRQALLEEKFRELVTDNVQVTPADVEDELRRRNENITIEYALVKAGDLAPTINPSDAELAAYFAKHQAKYQVPERRSARFALLDLSQLMQTAQPSDAELHDYYNQHITQYQVEDRVHVEHILLKTVGKTDAESAEIQKKAEDVLQQAKKGANFEDLAKKYSEDTGTKDKGGDLGWIVDKQTVPEFQQAAFSLPKGAISDLVKTSYGFHIIKVLDKESAHTKTFEEVRNSIVPVLLEDKLNALSTEISAKMASAIRQSNRQSLDDFAKKFDLRLGETPAASITQPVGDLGASPELHQVLFQLRVGELSSPLRIDRGYVVITPQNVQPAHAASLTEVYPAVLADYRKEKSVELARSKADDLAKRAQSGALLATAAKELGLETKTTDPFTRISASVGDLGPSKPFAPAFAMNIGQTSAAVPLQDNWVIYRIASKSGITPADLIAQHDTLQQQIKQTKADEAFDAFRTALEDRLKKEGKLVINEAALKNFTKSSS